MLISCGSSSDEGSSGNSNSNKPKRGNIQGSFNIDLTTIKSDPDGHSGCSPDFHIEVAMTGTEECNSLISVTVSADGWNNDQTEYRDYSCNLKPGTYAVEIMPGSDDIPPLMICCYDPLRCYTFDPLYGTFDVKAGETTQVLPETIVPYQAP